MYKKGDCVSVFDCNFSPWKEHFGIIIDDEEKEIDYYNDQRTIERKILVGLEVKYCYICTILADDELGPIETDWIYFK